MNDQVALTEESGGESDSSLNLRPWENGNSAADIVIRHLFVSFLCSLPAWLKSMCMVPSYRQPRSYGWNEQGAALLRASSSLLAPPPPMSGGSLHKATLPSHMTGETTEGGGGSHSLLSGCVVFHYWLTCGTTCLLTWKCFNKLEDSIAPPQDIFLFCFLFLNIIFRLVYVLTVSVSGGALENISDFIFCHGT